MKKQSKILNQIPIEADEPFEKICIDIFGPVNMSEYKTLTDDLKGNFLTITDVKTRYSQIYYMSRITDTKVIKNVSKWIKKFKAPKTLISDNGTTCKQEVREILRR